MNDLIHSWAKDVGVWISDKDVNKLVKTIEEKFKLIKINDNTCRSCAKLFNCYKASDLKKGCNEHLF